MCGIAGALHLDRSPVSAVEIQRMTDVIAHRGPDGEGTFVEEAMGLGHRRLSIIDLSEGGHQPMMSSDTRYVLSYNGEIYNYRELRTELESAGRRFRSQTDTEVLLQGFAEWGSHVVERLNGMYAFAIWDRTAKSMFLARDRYGIKPLYYYCATGRFIFASEIKAILQYPGISRALDHEALFEYLTFQNLFTDRTLIAGVHLLPAGCHLTLSPKSQFPEIQRYWDYHFEEPENIGDRREHEEELSRLFRQAVERQLVSDVELGSYLSGGLDSGSITAVAATHLPYIKTFTCGFDLHSASGMELGFDERETAEYMSYVFKTEHYEMVLKSGDMERCLPRLAWHLEEPRVGQSYPNYYVAGLASRFVKVVLSGGGGDELFGGYPWRYYRAVVNDDFEHYIDKYYAFWQRLVPADILRRMFAPVWHKVSHVSTKDIFRSVFASRKQEFSKPADYVNHSLYFEAKTFLHGLLVVEDKLSMAHSLEARVPFLDNDLVNFAMKTSVNLKLGNLDKVVRLNENDLAPKMARYFEKTRDGKLILRDAMRRLMPKRIRQAQKKGFSAPDATWFKGDSIDFVRTTLGNKNDSIYEVLDFETVWELVSSHLNGSVNRRLLIWSLLNVSAFFKAFGLR
ncbi:MAG: asparagine synthase (glutamine-hydrolyzing) [Verrucomicrobiales bacterium]